MKRSLLILGIALIITLSVVWGYLLFFGAPESTTNFFANFNFGDTEETIVVDVPAPIVPERTENERFDPNDLQQLTLKPVVGYQEISTTTSSTTFVYFIEAGTGHIFSINLETGAEVRLSNIIIPNAQAGEISLDGTHAVVQAGNPGEGELTIVELTQSIDNATSYPLINQAHDFTLTTTGEVLYTLKNSTQLQALAYTIEDTSTTPIFTIPFLEAVVLWGNSAQAEHHIYPKTASQLEGYLYRVRNGSMIRLPFDGFGFSALVQNELVLSSYSSDAVYQSHLFNTETNRFEALGLSLIPHKCAKTQHPKVPIVCGIPETEPRPETTDRWFKGGIQFSDELWGIGSVDGTVGTIYFTSLKLESGRQLDVITPQLYGTNNLYFINKTDRTLWKQVVQINI